MNEIERQGLELYADWAASHGAWRLVLAFKWRMLAAEQGSNYGLAWPVESKEA